MPEKEPQITVIGGGTGSFTLLSELKHYTSNINALVNMSDNGGSTGELRDEFGVLPPGDVRQCLVALSNDSEDLREQFNYRFEKGSLSGHSWGNIFLSGIEARTGSFATAVSTASEFLNISGRVVPITLDNVHVSLELPDGQKIKGESQIEDTYIEKGSLPKLSLDPAGQLNPEAEQAVSQADLVVIAPGDLYRSIGPTLVVSGLSKALAETTAPVAYVSNLVNKPNHTAEFAVSDYASEIERFAGGSILSHVLYNTDEPSEVLLKKYAKDREYPVKINQVALDTAHYQAIGGDFLSYNHPKQQASDKLRRTLIRHDGVSIAAALAELLKLKHPASYTGNKQ